LIEILIPIRFWNPVRWSHENPKGWSGDGFLEEALNRWVEIRKFLKVWSRNFEASKLGWVL